MPENTTTHIESSTPNPTAAVSHERFESRSGGPYFDLEMARDCRTPSDWLTKAARSSDKDILNAVARNPNTPRRDLLRLWMRFPEAIIENPIITLWEFTSADGISSKIPKKLLLNLYQKLLLRPDAVIPEVIIPVEWRLYFLKSHDFKPELPLHYFVRDTNAEVRLALLQRALPEQFEKFGPAPFPLESIEMLLLHASVSIQEAFANALANKWIAVDADSVDFLEKTARKLYSLGLETMFDHLSHWECLPPDLIGELSRHGAPRILIRLASLPRCTFADHARLAANAFPEVRAAVARFTRSVKLQERFFCDPAPEVRAGLASSPHIADEMQRRLISTKNASIHLALLNNPRVLPEILAYLARLPHTGCKNQIFSHPNIPQNLFDEFMANGQKHGVSQGHLAANPERLTSQFYKRHRHNLEQCVLLAYASTPLTSTEILAELACHTNAEIQKAVGDLVSPTSRQPSALSDNRVISIIEVVLNHPATTSEHPLLRSPRMSTDQALRIFENPKFEPVLRFSGVLNCLKAFRDRGLFSDYGDLYRKIVEPLTAMVPHLPTSALRPLTNHSEIPAVIREMIKNTPDGNTRASNFVQSYTIPLGAIMEAFPEAFPPTCEPCLEATPQQILQKLATSPHSLLAHYADRCLSSLPEKWALLVGRYPAAYN